MAYVVGNTEEDELQAQNQGLGVAPMAAPVASTGAAPISGGGGQAAPAPTNANSSKFVNFSQYMGANQGGAQATGDRIANTVGNQAQAVKDGTAKAESDTQAGIKAGSTYQGRPGITGNIYEEAKDRSKQTYTGPKSLQGYDALQKSSAEAQDGLSALQSPQGQQAYLAKFNGPSTRGGNALDAALLGATNGDRFRGLATKFGNLNEGLTAANNRAIAASTQAAKGVKTEADRWGVLAEGWAPVAPGTPGYNPPPSNDPALSNRPPPEALPGEYRADGTREPRPGEPGFGKPRTPETHVFAEEDPKGTSAIVANAGPGLMGTALGIANPAAGAAWNAGMQVNQAAQNSAGARSRDRYNRLRQKFEDERLGKIEAESEEEETP